LRWQKTKKTPDPRGRGGKREECLIRRDKKFSRGSKRILSLNHHRCLQGCLRGRGSGGEGHDREQPSGFRDRQIETPLHSEEKIKEGNLETRAVKGRAVLSFKAV